MWSELQKWGRRKRLFSMKHVRVTLIGEVCEIRLASLNTLTVTSWETNKTRQHVSKYFIRAKIKMWSWKRPQSFARRPTEQRHCCSILLSDSCSCNFHVQLFCLETEWNNSSGTECIKRHNCVEHGEHNGFHDLHKVPLQCSSNSYLTYWEKHKLWIWKKQKKKTL